MALQPACQIEFEQDDMDFACLDAGGADQLVNIDGGWPKGIYDSGALGLPDIGKSGGSHLFI